MYNSLKKVQGKHQLGEPVDRELHGGGSLPQGSYSKVTIVSLRLYDNILKFHLVDITGNRHEVRWQVRNKNGGWTPRLKNFLAGILPDLECQQQLLKFEECYRKLDGLKVSLTIAYSSGYRIYMRTGKYYGVDAQTNEILGPGSPSVKLLKARLEREGLVRATTNIDHIKPGTYLEDNIRSFLNGVHTNRTTTTDPEAADMDRSKANISRASRTSVGRPSNSTGLGNDRARPDERPDSWRRVARQVREQIHRHTKPK